MSLIWLQKHAPKTAEIPQVEQVAQLVKFVEGFKAAKKKAMLLHGPTGSGKTAAVYAVAAELGLEVMETNASDQRNADQMQSVLLQAATQASLFGAGKLLLVEEVDGISGNQDRGGVQALVDIISKSRHPIVLTANDASDKKFSALRKACITVEFPQLSSGTIAAVLKRICSTEGVSCEEGSLLTLSKVAGDMRAAITDLQMLVHETKKLASDDVRELASRDRTAAMQQALARVLKASDASIALGAFDNLDDDIDECYLWLEENLPLCYKKPEDLAAAFDLLSRADVFRGRIRRWQHWRFLSHQHELLTAGIASCKTAPAAFIQYQQPGRLLKMWIAKAKVQKRAAIAEKLAARMHGSQKQLAKQVQFIAVMAKDNAVYDWLTNECNLDEDEMEWLGKQSEAVAKA